MFHRIFHPRVFQALLFLVAGSIIVMLHHEQTIWQWALAGRLGITFLTFPGRTLALDRSAPFRRFLQQGRVLALACRKGPRDFLARFFTAFFLNRVLQAAAHRPSLLWETEKRSRREWDGKLRG